MTTIESPPRKKGKQFLVRMQVIIVAATFFAVAVTIFLGNQAYQENERMASEQFNRQQLILARSAATGIEQYFNAIIARLLAEAKESAVQEITPHCLEHMQHIYGGIPTRISIRRLDEKGILRLVYPVNCCPGSTIGQDNSGDTYFKEVRDTGRVAISGIIIGEHGDPQLRIAVPVYLSDNEKSVNINETCGIAPTPHDNFKTETHGFKGALVCSINLSTITRAFISSIVSGETGYAWLINHEGFLLAHPIDEFVGQDAFKVRSRIHRELCDESHSELCLETINRIQRQMLGGKEGMGWYVSSWHRDRKRRIKKLVSYTPVHVGIYTWSVAVCAPVDEVDRIMRKSHRHELYIFSFVILILTAAGAFLFLSTYRWSHVLEVEVENRTKDLRETRDYLDNLLDCANAPIIVWDTDFRVTRFNHACERLTGKNADEVLGEPFVILLPDGTQDEAMGHIRRTAKGEAWEAIEIPIAGADGDVRTVLWSSAPLYAEDSKTVVSTIAQGQDITDRKRAEKEKEKIRTQLRQAQKMEAIGTLAGGIAHDFNNILAAIIGYTEIGLLQIPKESPVRDDLREVLAASNRAKDLVQQILAFSRQGEQVLKPVQISPIVEEALKLLRSSLPATIEIRQHIEATSGTVMADPTQIHQILMNLCTNAAHAMRRKSGLLEVSLVDVEIDSEAVAQHPNLNPGPYLKLSVSDTGHGMDSKALERIFDPFFTTKVVGEGTGMGLAVVHGIVKSHGGMIAVQSEQGIGSTFDVFFPKVESAAMLQIEKSEPLPTGNERILFVDDEDALVAMARNMLEQLGYETFVRTSSIEALEAFHARPDKFDLVITDYTMPNMTGAELAKKLMRIRPDIPIILCTGYSERITAEKAKAMGIKEFVTKPIVMRDMAETIRRVLDEKP